MPHRGQKQSLYETVFRQKLDAVQGGFTAPKLLDQTR